MGYYETIDVTRSGHPGIVRGFTYSHHHHHRPHHREHRHHKCFDDCCGVPLSEYKQLRADLQRSQEEAAKPKLDKEDLKCALRDRDDKVRQLQGDNGWYHAENDRLKADHDRLRVENDRLAYENACLRQDIAVEVGKGDAFKRRIKVLEKDVVAKECDLRDRKADVKDLKRQVGLLNTKLDVAKDRYDRGLKARDRELLSRDEVIREQNSTIQRLQHLLEHFRGW
ncbi:uncharacterized protein PG986_009953 [Apiospora aurea]|uniref:Uncharacterized protein n=1 Tax=Apiospora aurea TaxID=335848 RepID=A0ABR1Q954_9PEZI